MVVLVRGAVSFERGTSVDVNGSVPDESSRKHPISLQSRQPIELAIVSKKTVSNQTWVFNYLR